jgi:hypothetical protein
MHGDKLKTFLSQKQAQLPPLENETAKKVQELMAAHVTENRLDNVRSKMRTDFVTNHHAIGRATREFAQDVLKDFAKDHSDI